MMMLPTSVRTTTLAVSTGNSKTNVGRILTTCSIFIQRAITSVTLVQIDNSLCSYNHDDALYLFI